MTVRHTHPSSTSSARWPRQGNLVPVYREILADLETPVSAFLKIDDGGDAFLLESVEGGEKWARYSFLGIAPRARADQQRTARVCGRAAGRTVRDARDERSARRGARRCWQRYRPVRGRAVCRASPAGSSAISATTSCASSSACRSGRATTSAIPTCYLMLVDTLVVFDNVAQTMKVVAHAHVDAGADLRARLRRRLRAHRRSSIERLRRPVTAPPPVARRDGPPAVRSNFEPTAYEAIVRARQGVHPSPATSSRSCWRSASSARCAPHPFDIYRCLRTVNPSPYMFFLRVGDAHRARRVARGDGAARGPRADRAADRRHAAARHRRARGPRARARAAAPIPKEIAEHIMLVDLGRNDVGRVARHRHASR